MKTTRHRTVPIVAFVASFALPCTSACVTDAVWSTGEPTQVSGRAVLRSDEVTAPGLELLVVPVGSKLRAHVGSTIPVLTGAARSLCFASVREGELGRALEHAAAAGGGLDAVIDMNWSGSLTADHRFDGAVHCVVVLTAAPGDHPWLDDWRGARMQPASGGASVAIECTVLASERDQPGDVAPIRGAELRSQLTVENGTASWWRVLVTPFAVAVDVVTFPIQLVASWLASCAKY